MPWTNDRVDTLKQLWTDGHSASVIATTIGEVTRNAVIGKAHRLGLAGRSPQRSKPAVSRPASLFPARARSRKSSAQPPSRPLLPARSKGRPKRDFIAPELGSPPDTPVTVQTLTALTCHWPIGDPKADGFHFCGRAKPHSRPYCDHHAAIAWR